MRGLALLVALAAGPVVAADPPSALPDTPAATPMSLDADGATSVSGARSGREIVRRFREGLADPECAGDEGRPYRAHFAHAPRQLAAPDSDVLPLFGYVVDALREAHLPTEYALIPFVESGYKPAARSPSGPTGMWQMIALTARNHDVPIRPGYDGRLSPVDSTRAAVRYLKTLHGMFAGDWRLAVMAYNAGEYRILGALKRSGMRANSADVERLAGVPPITRAYVRKLHALSCLMLQAAEREDWQQALDAPVPVLAPVEPPADARTLDALAARTGQDAARLRRYNPAVGQGRIPDGRRVLAAIAPDPARADAPPAAIATLTPAAATASAPAVTLADASAIVADTPPPRRHTVARGENAWTIARRYGVRVGELLERNGLDARAVLRPGQQLRIDAVASP